MIKYANNAFVNLSDKGSKIIQSHLSEDVELISGWMKENELIIKMKGGKTEARYLSIYVNSSLDLNSYFQRSSKKAAGQLKQDYENILTYIQ